MSYDRSLYCDVCGKHVKRGQEYFVHEQDDVVMCGNYCFEAYAIEYMENNVSYCEND